MWMSIIKRFIFVVCVFACFINVAWANEKVVLQLKWKHQFQFAGYYAAKAKGFYQEEGFDVDIKARDITTSPVDDVLAKRATFGIADSSIVLQRMNKKPVVVLSAIYQHSPLVLIALKSANINTPEDLMGKKVSYQAGIDGAPITAMFAALGIAEYTYEKVPFTFNDDILLEGNVDAFSAYITNQPALYRKKNISITVLDPRNYGIDFYGDMIFTSQEYVEGFPERALAFSRASIKGWKYALEHPDEIIDLIMRDYNKDKSKSRDLLEYEARATKPLIYSEIIPYGTINIERFARIANIYYSLGIAPELTTLRGLLIDDYMSTNTKFNREYFIVAIGISIFSLLVLSAFNRQLRRNVKVKTLALERANRRLKNNVTLVKEKNEQLEIAINKAKVASKTKSLFVANMSHEIRTPMNGIYGSLQLLRREDLNDNAQDLVSSAISSTQSLLFIINDILDFSKIEAGKLEIEKCVFNLHELIYELDSDFSVVAINKGIRFDFYIDEKIGLYWNGDPTRIKQVLINLISNAIKFTHEGKVKLTCHLGETLHLLDQNIIFTVEDTGIGMNDQALMKIFDEFDQADSSTTRKYGGTGLGMSICRNLVALMQGRLTVTSDEGKGSCFTVSIPLQPTESVEKHKKEDLPPPNLSGLTVLIAEDNRINQVIAKKMLSPTQAKVVIANNGEEAVNLYHEIKPDLILMDIQMPVLDGREACLKIREVDEEIYIIALTANVMKNDISDYLESGFNDHIGKPIEQNLFYRRLNTYKEQLKIST